MEFMNSHSDISSIVRLFFRTFKTQIYGESGPRPKWGIDLEDYDVDAATGCFPSAPLPRLTGPFEFWELALDEAEKSLCLGEDVRKDAVAKRADSEGWRAKIRSFPVLKTTCLEHEKRLLQRAHLVLAFLINFYAHSQPTAEDLTSVHIPECLAVPIVHVSQVLGIAPVLTFADTVLWNVVPSDPVLPLSANNMSLIHTFSNTAAERAFHITSARAELRGVELLRIIDDYVHSPVATDVHSISKTAKSLVRLATIVQEFTEIIQSVRDGVDPYIFFWEVRPWFRGTGNGIDRAKWVYDGVEDSDQLDLDGPSAGQSTVMHALDVFLDVDHKLQQKRSPAPSEDNKKADKGFMERMRVYMPGDHQRFLKDLSTIPTPIRVLARKSSIVRDAYDSVVLALKRFRDIHIRIAALYIVSMNNSTPPGTPEESQERERTRKRCGPVKGTGGNDLSNLLKAGRDATHRTVLGRK
ncbi:Indoleamine 2,3-dioxygenase [Auriscalpium vulgare]|uniref:Indoleamine 2,3-dioxygenase n=1 Tax=Auriscalpium vulgare TaxID=40419 RepID=A0ACB8SBU8_9AGAM|nr:Indoleamine 2,3-dioxygenase [Auriscalpium vulgare]